MTDRVKVLAFDTSLGACSTAVLEDGRVMASAFEVLGRGHAERLVPMVRETMEAAGVAFADLGLVAVTIGPGTFTGVRIGLAAARGFALAHGLPLAGVTSLEAVAACVFAQNEAGLDRLMVIHDARRGEVYMQFFERPRNESAGAQALDAPRVVPVEAVAVGLPKGPLAIAGTGVPLVKDAVSSAVGIIEENSYPDAVQVGRIAILHGPAQGPVRPLYLRAPDAKLPAART